MPNGIEFLSYFQRTYPKIRKPLFYIQKPSVFEYKKVKFSNFRIDTNPRREVTMLRRNVCLFILILLLASACNAPLTLKTAAPTQPAPLTLPPPTNTLPAASATPAPAETFTPAPATETAVPPSLTPAPKTKGKTKAPTATPLPKTIMLKIFLVGLNDNGISGKLVGCGDSVVATNVEVPYTTGVLKAAMTKLLSIKDQNYGQSGLYNALYQSSLKISSLALKDGVATIHLTGKVTLDGECDNPRVQAQLEQTALQFSTVKKVVIYINNVELTKALSLK
jgi:hypothetical protein